jgi:N-glycosylase/DNA lyase
VLLDQYNARKAEIRQALKGFSSLPTDRWLREVALCLLTPQSSPVRAEAAMQQLEVGGLFQGALSESEVADILRAPSSYVRFHLTRSKRLLQFVEQQEELLGFLLEGRPPTEERSFLVERVNGIGMKEGSHALRNIGRKNLAILDRHILTKLVELRVLEAVPNTMSHKKYLEIEQKFQKFSLQVEISMDELDLLFWAEKTGFVFK